MKKLLVLVVLFVLAFVPGLVASQQPVTPEARGMPGWPLPDKTVPHHGTGRPSRAGSYTTEAFRLDADGVEELAQLTGLEAMVADGTDPLAGNYTLVSRDKIMASWGVGGQHSVQTLDGSLNLMPGSEKTFGDYVSMDIAAGDLNNDGQVEQIAAWLDPADNHIQLEIGEMPGTLGRTTSAPAAVARANGEVDLLVRGYDEALWHCAYDLESDSCLSWDNAGGGTLISAPAAASLAAGQFEVYAIGTDNEIYHRHWEGDWSGTWEQVGDWPHDASIPIGPAPELWPLAAVARDGGIELFRVGPDNTLRWYDGSTWHSLGGMLASGPAVVSLNASHMQVFARGVDEALWHLTYNNGSWGAWKRLKLDSIDDHVTIASAPAAVSPAAGEIAVYVLGSDRHVWRISFDGSSWGQWVSVGGTLASGVAVAGGRIFAQAENGSLQQYDGTIWAGLGGLEPCCAFFDTGLLGTPKNVPPYDDFSLDLETGYFLGNGRSQIALAYAPSANQVTVALYDTGERFVPNTLTSVELPRDVDWFRIATGDFLDGDGVDEVAVAYVHRESNGAQSYGADIVRLSGENAGMVTDGTTETDDTRCWDGANPMKFAGTLGLASGDLDADGRDEIGMTVVFNCEDYFWIWACHTYRYHFRTRIFDATDAGGLTTYHIEDAYGAEVRRSTAEWSIGVSTAAGDVDGDGKDELIRTWPAGFGGDSWSGCVNLWETYPRNDRFSRTLQAYKLHTVSWPPDGGKIEIAPFYETPAMGTTYNSYVDCLAAGDLDRDLSEEMIWHIGTNVDRILRSHDYVVPEGGDPSWATLDAHLPFVYYPNLVTGDFTGESLRVGLPNYRRQYSVGRITAIINAPPKHVDTLNGVEYDINAGDAETMAKLTLGEGTTTDVSLTTMRDWGLSATFATTIGDTEATHTTNSLTTTYGQNFSKETGYVTTFEVQQTREASFDDALFYIRTDYDVWEYPVLVDPTGTAADYISVVFPASAPRLRVERGNTCDSWYQPRHQLGNVWSYPSRADQLVDRDESGSGDLVASSDYLVSEDGSSFTVNWGEKNVTNTTSGFELGFTHEFEWQVGGDELSFEIFGIGVSTRLPSFRFASKSDYNYSQLAEWQVDTTSDTEVYGYLNGVPEGDELGYDYAIWPYLYWAEDGYLMLDYTTAPEGTFWAKYDKPDPAFTLPWADGQCNTADNPDTEAFTRDILISPPVASAGQPVTLTATVRNFSLKSNTRAFNVTFYLGDPDAGGMPIGAPQTFSAYQLGPRDVETVTVNWTAAGSGDQRIYAVIDPAHELAEVHDENDPVINNNKGYGVLRIGALDIVDMGEAADTVYEEISYRLNTTMAASLFVPVGNLAENTRFDLHDADLLLTGIAGKVFELQVYRGEDNWDTPEQTYYFQPDTDHPPAVMILSYGAADIASMDESKLALYRFDQGGWEEATCPNYDVHRFPLENLVAVPICQASTFALSDGRPATSGELFLPVLHR